LPINFTRYFQDIIRVTGLIISGVICATFVVVLTIVFAFGAIHLGKLAQTFPDQKAVNHESGQRSRQYAETDFSSVTSWVLQCTKNRGANPSSGETAWLFKFPEDSISVLQSAPNAGTLFRAEYGTLLLNQAISKQRIDLHSKAGAAYQFSQIMSAITIALGLITTVVVSVSATRFGHSIIIIRGLAIFLPALGTAAAGVVAFYAQGPMEPRSPQFIWHDAVT
jgi:hypothetical protein